MKVIHIVSGDLWAGAEVMVYNLLQGLKKNQYVNISAIVLNDGYLFEKLYEKRIHTHLLDERKMSFFKIISQIKRIFKNDSPDIIHSHRYKENIVAVFAQGLGRGKNLITTQHGMPEVIEGGVGLRHRLISETNLFFLRNVFSKVVGVSEDIKNNFVQRYRINENKVSIIHNGVPLPEENDKVFEKESLVIGSAGRFFPVKDYPLMIEIARAVRLKTDKIRFRLAGDGPGLGKLQGLVKKYNLEEFFEFTGHLDNMSDFYQGLDIFLNTSVHEGIPMSILEAMAHKLPVIAPNVGGLSEIVDSGIDGYLIDSRDPSAFAEKCIFLHNNRKFYRNLSQAAREKIITRFSVDHMAEQYYNLYNKMEVIGE